MDWVEGLGRDIEIDKGVGAFRLCGGNVAVEGAVVAVWLAHASKSAERRKGCGKLGSPRETLMVGSVRVMAMGMGGWLVWGRSSR